MSKNTQLEKDLDFIRQAVEKTVQNSSPSAIYFLWALIVLVGFPLYDFAPEWARWFWTIAGPLGFVMSLILGWRHARGLGQVNSAIGLRHGLHWFGLLVTIFLAVPLGITGTIPESELARVIILIIALAYFLAGVHLDRPLLWVGVLMGIGYVALFFIPAYGWTLLGVLVAIALVAAGSVRRTSRVKTAS